MEMGASENAEVGQGCGDGKWALETLAVRKGEKVNCNHSRIPYVHPIQ